MKLKETKNIKFFKMFYSARNYQCFNGTRMLLDSDTFKNQIVMNGYILAIPGNEAITNILDFGDKNSII